jgi:hypothetical protein
MARRTRRVILAVLGAIVFALVLAVVLLPVLLPQDRLRAMAVERVRAATGGEVVLGDVSLKVLPRLRLVLGRSSLTLSEKGLRGAGLQPGSLDSARLGLERLELDLALAPLLKKQLEFGKIRLVAPDIEVVTHPAEAPGFGGAPGARRAGGGVPSPWGLALAGVEVRQGHVLWRETGTPRRVEIAGWKQELSGSDIGLVVARAQRLAGLPPAPGQKADRASGDATLGLHATVEHVGLVGFGAHPLPPLADLVFDAEIAIGPAADRATFAVTELSVAGWKVTLTGHADRHRVTVTELNLTGADGAVDLSGNLGFASPPSSGRLRGALSGRIDVAGAMKAAQAFLPPPVPGADLPPNVTGTLSLAFVAGDADAPPLNRADLWQAAFASGSLDTLVLTIESTDLVIAAPQLGEPLRLPRLEYRGDLSAVERPHHVVVRGLAHPVVQGDMTLDLGIGTAGAPHHADLKLGRFDLDALTAILQQQQQRGVAPQARVDWSLVGDAFAAAPGPRPAGERIPPDLKLDFTAVADEVLLMKMPYRGVRLAGDLTNRVVSITSLRANLGGGGDVTGTARVDYASDPEGLATFAFAAARVPASAMLQPYVPQLAALWEGRLGAVGRGSCRLGDQATVMRSLDLTGNLAAVDGRIDLSSLLTSIEPYLGDRKDLMRVTYSKYSQNVRIEAGKVEVSDLVIDGPQTDWTGGGWFGLDGTLDLAVRVKLPPNYVPNLGDLAWMAEALKDEKGRVDLGFRLTGRQTSPSVALDLDTSRLRGQASEQVKEKVREGLGGLLDKLKRK